MLRVLYTTSNLHVDAGASSNSKFNFAFPGRRVAVKKMRNKEEAMRELEAREGRQLKNCVIGILRWHGPASELMLDIHLFKWDIRPVVVRRAGGGHWQIESKASGGPVQQRVPQSMTQLLLP